MVIAVLTWTFLPAFLATYVPHTSKIPQTTPIQDAQPVYFKAEDGVNLFAWYISPTNGATVILRHGSGSTGLDTFNHAAVLVKHGYGVLITDARGHGSSGGTAMDFGWYGDTDIDAAVSFLLNQPEVDAQRIAIVGLSMGGEEAVGAIASNPQIATVVAEGVTARTTSDKAWYSEIYGFRGSIQIGLEWLQYTMADLLTEAIKPVSLAQAVEDAQRPVLLITAGKSDEEQHATAYIKQHAPDTVTVWNIPEAGHIQGLSVAPVEWDVTVTGFLDTALRQ
jgi:dipeptidyl aminopeptidase/acylaminoacyl peptidase